MSDKQPSGMPAPFVMTLLIQIAMLWYGVPEFIAAVLSVPVLGICLLIEMALCGEWPREEP